MADRGGMTATATSPRFRLSARARKTVLLVHIASAGSWLGMDLVLGLLVITIVAGDPVGAGAAATSIAAFAPLPLLVVGLLTLASGVLLGLGTKYGLLRYKWVLVKLVINVVLVVLVLGALGPEVTAVADAGRSALADGSTVSAGDLVFPPVTASLAMAVAMTLSVFKPWGRLRRRRVANVAEVGHELQGAS